MGAIASVPASGWRRFDLLDPWESAWEPGMRTYLPRTDTRSTAPVRAIETVATRKLSMLDAARTLEFLRSPPGNRLEALRADRVGQSSIRINDQWRLCFEWTDSGPAQVEIVDYH